MLVTVADAATRANPERAARRNDLYAAAIARHGGEPVVVSSATSDRERSEALATTTALLLTGGTDIDPARYGGSTADGHSVDSGRDALEAEAWAAAETRGLPVLGICRGHQAINVFSGGRLLPHVDGHEGPSYGSGHALTHPLRVAPGTRLARILFPTNPRGGVLEVNSFHHQAVRPVDLAPGLAAAATATSPAGELVEALEGRAGRFVIGVQFHPERQESTPPAFERLFAFFVDAARGAIAAR